MIVECPACHARFNVADAMIPENGRTVRCSRCTHAWHVERPAVPALVENAAAALPEIAKPAEGEVVPPDPFLSQLEAAMQSPSPPPTIDMHAAPSNHKPARKRPPRRAKPFQIAAGVLATAWLVLALFAYFPSWATAPGLSGIYGAMGGESTEGLLFSDVTMTREQEGNKTRFILSGSIRNHANVSRKVPVVRVSMRDKSNNAMWGRDYPVNAVLKAGEVYPFRITNIETIFAGNVSSIVVDMGNALQLMLR